MIEAGGRFRFPAKTLHVRFACPLAICNDFKCDCAVETFLTGAVNHALAAPTDFFQQFVITELDRRAIITCY